MEKAIQILTPHASPRQTGTAAVTASPAAGRILINDSAVLRHGLGGPPRFSPRLPASLIVVWFEA